MFPFICRLVPSDKENHNDYGMYVFGVLFKKVNDNWPGFVELTCLPSVEVSVHPHIHIKVICERGAESVLYEYTFFFYKKHVYKKPTCRIFKN